jgi:hypothetical protein
MLVPLFITNGTNNEKERKIKINKAQSFPAVSVILILLSVWQLELKVSMIEKYFDPIRTAPNVVMRLTLL